MRLRERIVRVWDWIDRLHLVWLLISAPVLAAIYFAWAYFRGVPLPYLLPLSGAVLVLILLLILAVSAIYDGFRAHSPLEVFMDPQNERFWESTGNPNTDTGLDDEEKYGQFFSVEVMNNGPQTVQGVTVVYWHDGQTNQHRAYGTGLRQLTLHPGARKMVKLFFQSYQVQVDIGELSDPPPLKISVRAIAKDTLASPVLRLDFCPTGKNIYDEGPLYSVAIRKAAPAWTFFKLS